MDDWKLKRQEMDGALKRYAVPLLREIGFKGSYPHYRRLLPERVDTIGFQFSQWGPQFYIEIGVADSNGFALPDGTYYAARTLKYYQCPVRVRIGKLPFDFAKLPVELIADAARNSIDEAKTEWETIYNKYRSTI